MDMNIEELIAKLGNRFIPEKAVGVEAVIQFHLEGAQSGLWYLQIKEQKCELVEGRYANPTIAISADAGDLKEMLSGDVSLMKAYMNGMVKMQGDFGQAMKLRELFQRD